MYIVKDIKTGLYIPVNDQNNTNTFSTKEEALSTIRKDINKINTDAKRFCKSYDIPFTSKDRLDVKNYEIIEIKE